LKFSIKELIHLLPTQTRSLGSRIWLYCTLLGVVLLTLIWVLQIYMLDFTYLSTKTKTVDKAAASVRSNFGQLDSATFLNYISEVSTQNDLYLSVMSNEYTMILVANPVGRSYGPQSLLSSGGNRIIMPLPKDYIQNFYHKVNESKLIVENIELLKGWPMILYGEKIVNSQGISYVLIIASPLSPMSDTVKILANQLIFITVIMFILTTMLAFLMSRYVSVPFQRIIAETQRLATPEFRKDFHEDAFTEAKQMAQNLVATQTRLEQVDNLRNELIANMSHDLRTPLTMIRLYAEMIEDFEDDQKEDRIRQADIIIQECDRLTNMVQMALDYSKMKSGFVLYNPEVFDICGTIRNVLLRYLPNETDEYLITSNLPETRNAWGESKSIENVLFNLINNAIHHSESKVHISIYLQTVENRIRVHVKDNGPGIPQDQMDTLWVRYHTANTTRKTAKNKNIGLGLSIVAAIMELHHMPYGVKSEVGKGSDFWFDLEEIRS